MCFGKKAGSTTIKIADNTTGMDYRMSFTVIASVPFKIDRGNGLTNQTQPLIVDFEGKWKITSSYGWSVYSPNNGIIKVTDINHNNGTITFKALRSDISYISGKPGLTYILITEKETGAWQKHWVQVKPYVTGIKISGFSGPVAGDVQNLTAKTYSQNYVGQKGHGTIIWSSSNANIATVNQNGKVSFLAPGTVKITVTYSDGKHPSKSAYVDYKVGKLASKLKVTDVVLRDVQNKTTITKGQSIMWNIKSAKGWKISSPNNGIIKLSWNKNNNTVTFTGNNYGTTTITISEYYTGISKTYTIEVRKPSEVKFNLNNISMKVGDKKTITYSTNYNEKVTWKIENTNIAGVTVDYSNKKITIEGKKPGTTSIKIWLDNGKYSVCNINVVNSIIESAKKIKQYIADNGYEYCLDEECKRNQHLFDGHKCGLTLNYEDSKIQGKYGYHNTCCATFVSWVLIDAGIVPQNAGSHTADLTAIRKSNKFYEQVSNFNASDIKAGDILIYTDGQFKHAHVEIAARDGAVNNRAFVYNAGGYQSIHYEKNGGYSSYTVDDLVVKLRLK